MSVQVKLNYEIYAPLRSELVSFYAALTKADPLISEKDLFLEFERKFGEDLLYLVCIPHHLKAGACVMGAIEMCRRAE